MKKQSALRLCLALLLFMPIPVFLTGCSASEVLTIVSESFNILGSFIEKMSQLGGGSSQTPPADSAVSPPPPPPPPADPQAPDPAMKKAADPVSEAGKTSEGSAINVAPPIVTNSEPAFKTPEIKYKLMDPLMKNSGETPPQSPPVPGN